MDATVGDGAPCGTDSLPYDATINSALLLFSACKVGGGTMSYRWSPLRRYYRYCCYPISELLRPPDRTHPRHTIYLRHHASRLQLHRDASFRLLTDVGIAIQDQGTEGGVMLQTHRQDRRPPVGHSVVRQIQAHLSSLADDRRRGVVEHDQLLMIGNAPKQQ